MRRVALDVAEPVGRRTTTVGGFPWRVGIEGRSGSVRGAGVLLDRETVLTCAHVVADRPSAGGVPTEPVTVRFVGAPGVAVRSARVPDSESWIPPDDDGRGDLALLRLDQPVTEVDLGPVRLRRDRPTRDTVVLACGFPDGEAEAVWSHATAVASGGPHREWWQLDWTGTGTPIARGFSGGAVLDAASDDVLGIVVASYDGRDDGRPPVAFMISVETIGRRLPRVRPLLSGPLPGAPTSDPGRAIRDGRRWSRTPEVLDRWLDDAEAGEILLLDDELLGAVDVGSHGSRSDGGRRPPVTTVHAAGRSVAEITRALERAGLDVDARGVEPPRTGRPRSHGPVTLVIRAADGAADPDAVSERVLVPVVRDAGRLGVRLVAGVSDPSGTVVRAALGCVTVEQWRRGADLVISRVERDEKQLCTDEHSFVETVATAPILGDVRPYRALLPHDDPGRDATVLRRVGGRLVALPVTFARRRAEVDARLERLRTLRSEVDSLRARAVEVSAASDVEEDAELDDLYAAAHRALHRRPFDLGRGTTAVRAYGDEIRRRERVSG